MLTVAVSTMLVFLGGTIPVREPDVIAAPTVEEKSMPSAENETGGWTRDELEKARPMPLPKADAPGHAPVQPGDESPPTTGEVQGGEGHPPTAAPKTE